MDPTQVIIRPVVSEKTSLSGCPALWSVYLPGTTETCWMITLSVAVGP